MKPPRLVLFDIDGTLLRGSEPVEHAPEAVARLRGQGSRIAFLTNNSAAEPCATAARLARAGIQASQDEVFGTGPLAARRLRALGHESAYVLGEPELESALAREGVAHAEDAPAVLVGICRSLTYARLDRASALARRGAPLFATNRDATYPVEGGGERPGAGAVLAAVETASGRQAVVFGKPEPALALEAMAAAGVGPEDTLLVGDRPDTDIACAQAAGCRSLLVLTGVAREAPPGVAWAPDLRGLGRPEG